ELMGSLSADCDEPSEYPVGPVAIAWEEVDSSHPTIGIPGQMVEVERYEVALEREDDSGLKMLIELPPEVTAFAVPAPFTSEAGQVKFEVLAKAENGNRTAIESCFLVY